MSEKKPSDFRYFLSVIGSGFRIARSFTANALFVLFIVLVLSILFSGPDITPVPDGGALVINPEGSVVEKRSNVDSLSAIFGGGVPSEVELKSLIESIDRAREDSRIKLLLLNLEQLVSINDAQLQSLGEALDRFKSGGKEIWASGSYYSQSQYFLASYADAVYMHPMGQVLLQGYGAFGTYLQGLLEKLKVNVHVFRVGTYKAAVEPFIRSDMSPAAKEANRALTEDLWQQYSQTVTSNRKIQLDDFLHYAEAYPEELVRFDGDMARVALEHNLIDELLTPDQMNARLIDYVGGEEEYQGIGFQDYLKATQSLSLSSSSNQIAVIVARGPIVAGNEEGSVIGANALTDLIKRVRRDDDVQALVLRVDSPGGSAFASELIRQELELTQLAGKPVVISMAGVAASGGYWISATADKIVAAPGTITGSIGIFGLITTFENSLTSIGVETDGVGTTPLSGVGPLQGINEPMAKILQANVENGYRQFINLVARGRDMTPEEVDGIAQGRPWSGARALELGLIDKLGNIQDAIELAAEEAELESWETHYFRQPLSPQEELARQIAENFSLNKTYTPDIFTSMWNQAQQLFVHQDPMKIYSLCTVCDSARMVH